MSSPARPNRPARLRRLAAAGLAVVLVGVGTASPAAATPQTLLRGLGNVLMAPIDAALSPVTALIGIYQNMQDIDDSRMVRIVYPIPGYFYAVNLNLGCAMIRLISGGLEIVPGIPLVFMETDMESLFDPVFDARALGEVEFEFMDDPLRFGVDYTTPGF